MGINIHNIQEEVLLKSVLDTVDDDVTVIDREFRVIFHNASIQKKFGNISGQLCYEAYRGRVESCTDCLIGEVLEDGKQRKILRDTLLPDNSVMWMECVSGALKDEGGPYHRCG